MERPRRFRLTKYFSAALLLLPLAVSVPLRAQQESRNEKDYSISMNVDLVVLHATVKERSGGFASVLGKQHFRIYEDGQPQQIKVFQRTDIPVTMGLVVDHSGSMTPKRSEVILAALQLAQASNPQDEIFVIHFNESVSLGLPADTPFTGDVNRLRAALSAAMPSGQTALYDAISAALDHLRKGKMDKRVLIVLSDGGDNASRHGLQEVLATAQQSNAIIYTVGLFDEADKDRNPGVLKRLAQDTGGEAFLPENIKQVAGICRRIATDIRNQYILSYVPLNTTRDGAWRKVRVEAEMPDHGKLRVRTRAGYYALSDAAKPVATPAVATPAARNRREAAR